MADRYRAYATIKAPRKVDGEMQMVDASGDVAFDGEVPESGIVKFDSGDIKIRRVAFYKGPMAEEVCLGSVELNAVGKISVSVDDIPKD